MSCAHEQAEGRKTRGGAHLAMKPRAWDSSLTIPVSHAFTAPFGPYACTNAFNMGTEYPVRVERTNWCQAEPKQGEDDGKDKLMIDTFSAVRACEDSANIPLSLENTKRVKAGEGAPHRSGETPS